MITNGQAVESNSAFCNTTHIAKANGQSRRSITTTYDTPIVNVAQESKMEIINSSIGVQLQAPLSSERSRTTAATFRGANGMNDRRDTTTRRRTTEPSLQSSCGEGSPSSSNMYQETINDQPPTLPTSRSLLQPLPLAMDNVMRTMESCASTAHRSNTCGLNSVHHPLYHSQSMPLTSRGELYTTSGEEKHQSYLDVNYGSHIQQHDFFIPLANQDSSDLPLQRTPLRSQSSKSSGGSLWSGHSVLPSNGFVPESPVSAAHLGGTGGSTPRFYNTNGHFSTMAPSAISVPVAHQSKASSVTGDERGARRYGRSFVGGERRSPPPPSKRGPLGGHSSRQNTTEGGSSSTRTKDHSSVNNDHQTGHHDNNKSNSQSPRLTGTKPHSPRSTGIKPPSTQGLAGGHGLSGGGSNLTIPVHNHGPRTPPEILKTLLRKKACLYEAGGTSYAIALVTWLVGRELTLRSGYFTRQELQYGVHNVVGEIIESGSITRTKVNRCMQIILNSCFHYIIPSVGAGAASPSGDGGGSMKDLLSAKKFRDDFAARAANDDDLLWTLDAPWQGLDIDDAIKGTTHEKSGQGNSPPASPKSSGSQYQRMFHGPFVNEAAGHGPDSSLFKQSVDDDESSLGSSKKVVLLCFNENVNSFEEAWRCHNEFIRDVAHSENLRLTAKEWKDFYSRVSHSQISGTTSGGTSAAPHYSPSTNSRSGGTIECSSSEDGSKLSPVTKGSLLRPVHVPHELAEFSLDDGWKPSHSYAAAAASSMVKKPPTDLDSRFTSMSIKDLHAFRTTWCSKRYDHDHSVCAFAHVEINGGWLRRNPHVYGYCRDFCPNVEVVKPNEQHFLEGCLINKCSKGVHCEFSHSQEEVDYHPESYKKQDMCSSCKDSNVLSDPFEMCPKGLVCPFLHTPSQHSHQGSGRGFHLDRGHRRPTRGDGVGLRHGKGHARTSKTKGAPRPNSGQEQIAEPCSTLYIDPAPVSEMEKSFGLPGLRLLFRQRCAACVQQLMNKPLCSYDSF